MEMKKNLIFKKFHRGHERNNHIKSLALHGSAGLDNAKQLFNWWDGLFSGKYSDDVSIIKKEKLLSAIGFYHYIIDVDGTVFNTHSILRWFYHSHSGFADSQSIAICLVNTGSGNSGHYNDDQYNSLNELIHYLETSMDTLETIDTHSFRGKYYSKIDVPTPCPGLNFDWDNVGTNLEIRK